MKRTQKAEYFLAAAAALITLVVYLPALRNNFVEWDDGIYVSENPSIRSLDATFFKWAFSNFSAANWHPLTWISHALDYAVWGLNPLGHHLTSVILHALNTFLVVLLMIRLLDAYTARHNPSPLKGRMALIAAGTAGLLFGLHPVHVESVAWVAERKDVLCALFFLLSVMMYVKYISGRRPEAVSPQSAGHYLLALGFFVLALMSKPMAVSLPIVLLILDWHPFDRLRSWKAFLAACAEKLPFFALSLASSIVTVVAQRAGGAILSTSVTPLQTRLLVAAKAVTAYLGNMAWPLDLVPFYPYPETASCASWEYFAPIALAAGITVLCVVLALKKRKTWLSAWGYYGATLAPVLGIVQVGGQSMADRYTYLPSLGPFLVLGLGAAWLWDKAQTQRKLGPVVKLSICCAAACTVFFLSFATIKQTGVWKDSLSLWTYVIDREPEVSLAYNNRGLTYNDMGLFDLAIRDFDRAIALAPSEYKAYSNRGKSYVEMGMLGRAIGDFEQAIALSPSSPEAYNNLGIAFAKAGLFDKALELFTKTILVDQSQGAAYYNRGLLYLRAGDKERADADYRKACDRGHDVACRALRR